MPRPPRVLVDDACYHILTRGNNRTAVFYEAIDRQRYGQWLLTFSQAYGVRVYHYCLMTNHVHLVVRATTGTGLRQALQRLNLTYAHYLHRSYGHTGHVWQDRFKSLLIADDRYLLQCGLYVEGNPVRATLVGRPEEYPWSSYRVYAAGVEDPIVTLSPAYLALGSRSANRQRQYRQLFVEDRGRDLPSRWLSQRALGSPESLATLSARSQFPLLPPPQGRPRKSLTPLTY